MDVADGIENTLVILRHRLKSGMRVRRQYAQDPPRIQASGASGGQLHQVWTNMVDNATDAIGERGGEITVRTSRDREGGVVEIEDDCPGISPGILPRTFESFFTARAPGKGSGLGLLISRNIVVHRRRGTIDVTSRPGKTSVRVCPPVNFEPR